jgi:putative ABC transport system ATP-binding protein
VIDVRGVTKTFHRGEGAVHAVRDASLRVGEGELVGLVGRSGSGKTTLLNILSGWERADEGGVTLADGRTVDRSVPWSEIAVLPQRLGLIEELTVRENIEYPARLAGLLASTADLTDELIDDLGLFPLQHRYPRETSVGEQQRTALARALVLTPGIVLADEPTGHQDGEHARDMLEAIRRAVARGTACVAATHSEELIRYLDRVLTMEDGRLSG